MPLSLHSAKSYLFSDIRCIRKKSKWTYEYEDIIWGGPTPNASELHPAFHLLELAVVHLGDMPHSAPWSRCRVRGVDDQYVELRVCKRASAPYGRNEDAVNLVLKIAVRARPHRLTGSGIGNGSDSSSLSNPATTPSPGPTIAAHSVTSLARCKSIKPLTITKRGVSPAPLPAESAAPPECTFITLAAPLPPSFLVSSTSTSGDDLWEDDDDFYATHAGTVITLAALPPSFASTSRSRRESVVLPGPAPTSATHCASVRLSRAISIPARPPIITSLPLLSGFSTPSLTVPLSRPRRGHPSPRTHRAVTTPSSRLPFRRCSPLGPFPRDPHRLRPPPPRLRVRARASRPSSPAPRIGAPSVPSDVDDEWEECECEHAYDIPLSPFVAPASAESKASPSSASTSKSFLALRTPRPRSLPPTPTPLPLRRVPTLGRALRSLHNAAPPAPARLHRLSFLALFLVFFIVCVAFRAVGERALESRSAFSPDLFLAIGELSSATS
ncbi:hypothetical protein DFH09DRAFT_1355892 [Mycena vulgaris]|nr:hypothetical protein DFH09DRAFT_1355892 [Mycena vulgaris]